MNSQDALAELAKAMAEPAHTPAAAVPTRIQGRVDAIEGGRLFGWVWDQERPGERVTVEVTLGDRPLAQAVADKQRIDLKRNGIGDGLHAFDIELPAEAAGREAQIGVVARGPNGESVPLRVPSSDERAAEAAVAVPMARVLDKLDLLLAAQRHLQIGQRDAFTALKETTARLDQITADEGGISRTVDLVGSTQQEMSRRIDDVEVFLMRFDSTLAGFDTRLKALQTTAEQQVKPMLIMLAMLGGFIAGIAATIVAR